MAVIIDIKVLPQSGKQYFKLDKNDRIVCYLKSAPERGLANKELTKLIAQLCGLTLAEVTIIGGATSRNKRVKIETTSSKEELLQALGVTKQLNLF